MRPQAALQEAEGAAWEALGEAREVQNYTWTMPDNEGKEDVVWGGATRHDTI